jgi:hypothetical protein
LQVIGLLYAVKASFVSGLEVAGIENVEGDVPAKANWLVCSSSVCRVSVLLELKIIRLFFDELIF